MGVRQEGKGGNDGEGRDKPCKEKGESQKDRKAMEGKAGRGGRGRERRQGEEEEPGGKRRSVGKRDGSNLHIDVQVDTPGKFLKVTGSWRGSCVDYLTARSTVTGGVAAGRGRRGGGGEEEDKKRGGNRWSKNSYVYFWSNYFLIPSR